MTKAPNPSLVTVFGGSGFLGRHVVRLLAERGYRVRVAVRRPDLAGHLKPLGDVGQIQLVQANVRYRQSVMAAAAGSSAVVNLVGILAESGRQRFDAVQKTGARAIADAAKNAGARLVHVSAIGADRNSKSAYGRTKAEGEAAVRAVLKDTIILRPSIQFGPGDDFFNRFASIARLSPVLPLMGAATRFQPAHVADVAEAVARAVDGKLRAGTTYELGGPRVATLRECMELMLEQIGRNRLIINIPWPIALPIARLIGWIPYAPITSDQAEMLKIDNVVSAAAEREKRTFEGIGIKPVSMQSILPSYLVQYRPQGQFTGRTPSSLAG